MCIALAGCTGKPKPTAGDAELRKLLPAWFDEMNTAAKYPRKMLPAQIERMQSLRHQAEAIPVSECMQAPKTLYIQYMRSKIDILIDFVAEKENYVNGFNEPAKDLKEFEEAAQVCADEEHKT